MTVLDVLSEGSEVFDWGGSICRGAGGGGVLLGVAVSLLAKLFNIEI